MRVCRKCGRQNVSTKRGPANCDDCRSPTSRPPKKAKRRPTKRQCLMCQRICKIPHEIRPHGRKCVTCLRETKLSRQRERYAQDPELRARTHANVKRWAIDHPELRREYERRFYYRMKEDPERHERELADRRIRDRLNGSVAAKVAPRSDAVGGWTPTPRNNHAGKMLDIGPLVDWLKREFLNWPTRDLATYVGIDDSHLGKILSGEYKRISLHVADQICVAADCTHMLALLYPEVGKAA